MADMQPPKAPQQQTVAQKRGALLDSKKALVDAKKDLVEVQTARSCIEGAQQIAQTFDGAADKARQDPDHPSAVINLTPKLKLPTVCAKYLDLNATEKKKD